jgi:hypothetical protein
MKQLLSVLLTVIIGSSTFSQTKNSPDFNGKWISEAYKDTIRLNFLDEHKGLIQWKTWSRTESPFIYTSTMLNGNVILTIKSPDKSRQDSLNFTMTKVTPDGYKLISIMHEYSDGRPPESELLPNVSYILRKQ